MFSQWAEEHGKNYILSQVKKVALMGSETAVTGQRRIENKRRIWSKRFRVGVKDCPGHIKPRHVIVQEGGGDTSRVLGGG